MAKPKIHWYYGCGWGRAYDHQCSAARFTKQVTDNPDWFCVTCTTKARLALAAESAPKPDDMIWPKPRPISDAPKDGCILGWVPDTDELRAGWELLHYSVSATEWHDNAGVAHEPTHFLPLPPEVSRDLASTQESHYRTDSERYAELRMLVEDWLEAMDPASPVVVFDNALRLVLDWRHR